MEQSRVARLSLLLVAFFALSCTRAQNSATVSFSVPKFTQAQKLTYAKIDPNTIHQLDSSGTNFNTLLNPTVTTDLNCFVVFVGGDGFDQGGTCTVSDGSTFKLGDYAGGVLSGGTATIAGVPAGTRTIILVGFHASSTSFCTDFHGGINQSQLSEPFIVAQTKLDVQANSSPTVDMTASLTTSKITDCKFANDNGGGAAYFGSGADGDITSGSGTQSLTSMTNPSGQYLMSISEVTSIIDNGNGTAQIKVNQAWNVSSRTNVNDGDEIMLYVSGTSSGNPNGCYGHGTNDQTDGVYSGFSYSGRVSGTQIGSTTGGTFNIDLGDRRWLNIPAANLTATGVGATPATFCHVLAVRVPQINSINLSSGNLTLWTSNAGIYDINAADQTTAGLLPIRVKNGITLGSGVTLSFVTDGAGYHGGTSSAPTAPTGQSALGLVTATGTNLPYLEQGGGLYGGVGCGGGHGGIGGCSMASAAGQTVSDDHGCGSDTLNVACLLGKFFFGGGGGSGGGSAGNGGGALRIFTSQISLGSSSVLTFSASGTSGSASFSDGGGAGGSILLSTTAIAGSAGSNLNLKALGGAGGNSGSGNGGGGGRIHVIAQDMTGWLGTLNGDVSGGTGASAGTSGTCYSSGLTLACTAP